MAMYVVDGRDRVVPVTELPQSSAGAPIPYVVADEFSVVVGYYLQNTPPGWDGSWSRLVGPDTPDEPVGVVRFTSAYAHMFGPPNDEAFQGHPLASRGLRPYGAFEIEDSSWIRGLERMNTVHPSHRPEHFKQYRHYILAFHDSTFECVAHGFDARVLEGPISAAIPAMVALLTAGAA